MLGVITFDEIDQLFDLCRRSNITSITVFEDWRHSWQVALESWHSRFLFLNQLIEKLKNLSRTYLRGRNRRASLLAPRSKNTPASIIIKGNDFPLKQKNGRKNGIDPHGTAFTVLTCPSFLSSFMDFNQEIWHNSLFLLLFGLYFGNFKHFLYHICSLKWYLFKTDLSRTLSRATVFVHFQDFSNTFA